ncbi:hypothetical protein NOV72_02623 [Caballeronia novacaledonica]|uniref:Uncharacterized protein n=1 Tax=Caballeronia novacaledonica TaxID=1544861 RepID=A0A2U3I5J6_9BURK|nr:Imm52 family immunity protein [Caballeronia novacaledonica]SPB15397.1 hypothetical protein NOV72_02623 [Caballeronia novacaledonica]
MNQASNDTIRDVNIWIALKTVSAFPSTDTQSNELWRFAKLLEELGFDMSKWCVSGDPNDPAFTEAGPTNGLIASAAPEADSLRQAVDIWNGKEGRHGAGFSSRYALKFRSSFDFRADGFQTLDSYNVVVSLVERALQIWPGLLVEVCPYHYSTQKKVFKDRPGVGWMLYLPRRIEIEQVPEARMIHHVKDLNGTEGTILISEIDGPFDADNPEHVKVANAIEIRLADQDLLPRYVDLS